MNTSVNKHIKVPLYSMKSKTDFEQGYDILQ